MADWRRVTIATCLADGVKNRGETLKALKRELLEDEVLDEQEIKFLTDLRTNAYKRAKSKKETLDPAFDAMFFKLLYDQLMDDGEIDKEEAGWLREVLFADGKIDAQEKAFLQKLKRAAKNKTSPEFEKLYEECMAAKR